MLDKPTNTNSTTVYTQAEKEEQKKKKKKRKSQGGISKHILHSSGVVLLSTLSCCEIVVVGHTLDVLADKRIIHDVGSIGFEDVFKFPNVVGLVGAN